MRRSVVACCGCAQHEQRPVDRWHVPRDGHRAHQHDRWDVQVETEAQSIQRRQSDREHEQRREDRECESRVLGASLAAPWCHDQFYETGGGDLPGIDERRLGRCLSDLQGRGSVRCEIAAHQLPVICSRRSPA